MKKKNGINRTLLLKVKEQILNQPSLFIMDTWVVNEDDREEYNGKYEDGGLMHKAKCGTMACIGGWTCLLGLQQEEYKKVAEDETWGQSAFAHKAEELLGLTHDEAEELFFVCGWPGDLTVRWCNAKTAKERANIAAERIDRVIAEHCDAS